MLFTRSAAAELTIDGLRESALARGDDLIPSGNGGYAGDVPQKEWSPFLLKRFHDERI
jgi:hypothetical protein